MEQNCIICGEEATGLYAENPKLPLCPLPSCEQALVNDINFQLQEAATEAAKENQ